MAWLARAQPYGSGEWRTGARTFQAPGEALPHPRVIGASMVNGNGGPGLQAKNSGVLQSYGTNMTEGNGGANVGVPPAPPS